MTTLTDAYNAIECMVLSVETAEAAAVAYVAGDTAELGRIISAHVAEYINRRSEYSSASLREVFTAAAGIKVRTI